jgi:hypothetical protein
VKDRKDVDKGKDFDKGLIVNGPEAPPKVVEISGGMGEKGGADKGGRIGSAGDKERRRGDDKDREKDLRDSLIKGKKQDRRMSDSNDSKGRGTNGEGQGSSYAGGPSIQTAPPPLGRHGSGGGGSRGSQQQVTAGFKRYI